MPRSRTRPERVAKARRYGRVLAWWEADRALCPAAHKLRDKPRKAARFR